MSNLTPLTEPTRIKKDNLVSIDYFEFAGEEYVIKITRLDLDDTDEVSDNS